VTVVAKFGSSPRAAASSFKVSRVAEEESTSAAIAACTNAVVEICVVFVQSVAVGAVGIPVSAVFASCAFTYAVVASCVVLVAVAGVGAVGVPVSAGEARSAFAVLSLVTSSYRSWTCSLLTFKYKKESAANVVAVVPNCPRVIVRVDPVQEATITDSFFDGFPSPSYSTSVPIHVFPVVGTFCMFLSAIVVAVAFIATSSCADTSFATWYFRKAIY
jgi:hypothetical protein